MLSAEEVFEITDNSSIEWRSVNTVSNLEVFVSSYIESFIGRHCEIQNLVTSDIDASECVNAISSYLVELTGQEGNVPAEGDGHDAHHQDQGGAAPEQGGDTAHL